MSTQKAFGSGYFGEWVEDEFGLPAYRYTCDQVNDPKAVTAVHEEWRAPTDHSHQVGNDRLVGVASNYGYVLVRQDEGAPKFLNDFDPPKKRYGGGFGYLCDGETTLSTFYPGRAETFERIFGIGYLRKTVSGGGYQADQVVFAPFGDDPLLISQVTIANQSSSPANLRWIEYWDCQPYQFSFRSSLQAILSRGKKNPAGLRRALSNRFRGETSVIGNREGLLNRKRFLGYGLRDRLGWAAARLAMATVAKKFIAHPVKAWVKEAAFDDLTPPPVFLAALDGPADGLAACGEAFFGRGGVENPDGLAGPFPSGLAGEGSGLLLERKILLQPGEKKTLYFAYGYLPEGFELEQLLSSYRQDPQTLLARSCAAWKRDRIQLAIPDEPWVDRELAWHHYYLRSSMTYDSFFQEHILSQGNVYQYLMGFQGAARDPLQHALPFTFSQPEIVRKILRYTLKEVLSNGEIPYGITGHGMLLPAPFRPSDLELWLLWLAGEYVLATRDSAFLDEVVPLYPVHGKRAPRMKVKDILALCYRHLTQATGTGAHGLLRLSNGDWNDVSVLGFVPKDKEESVRIEGESVLNAAFSTYALDVYARMLAYSGDHSLAADARRFAAGQCAAVEQQWAGRFFRRMWLGPDLGWIGADILWLEPQPWAIIGGAATPDQLKTLVPSINELVRDPSPIGALLLSQGSDNMLGGIGVGTNAGIWPSINGTLVWALAMADGRLGWEEWRKNSLALHAEAYPEVWYGIWSGPDTYNSVLSQYPGHTIFHYWDDPDRLEDNSMFTNLSWTDFPVMNLHPHAWPVYDVVKLMGIEFAENGVKYAPAIPKMEYRFSAPLIGLEKSARGYSGWYAPACAGQWQITVQLPTREIEQLSRLKINQQERPFSHPAADAVFFTGESEPGQPLVWELIF